MKKNIILIAALLVAISATTAFAAATGSTTTYSTSLPTGLPGKLSTNVNIAYISASDNSGYTAGTAHAKGTKTFASSSGDAAIFSFDATNQAIPAAPVGTASAGFGTGWSAL